MELEEQDDSKMRLLRKSAMHREQLEDEVKDISDRTERILTNALIIGGTLAATYFVVRIFTSSGEKKKSQKKVTLVQAETPGPIPSFEEEEEESSSVLAQVGTALATQAAVFLLDFAREKLTEYIQSQTEEQKRDSDGRP
jgi:hypothetical protein